ncbi:Choline kinase [Ectothiorhodosinus mongolicus]|uniref:Choline kinase n=2 Tax=Ectothiorhodosinus mongolicus TaxID=233100 RepID=A0A1R3VTV4_9GAMM|nr:phosphocholine cytidylyltransferase family protein [Ectothiorhodosinus mongolicus]SIT68351.1 Choline kinase [Ectothiorhodosinus mongolicus]
MQAVILAAGRGSRLGSMTDAAPKGMVEVAGKPILDWQRRALLAGGAEAVTVVTGYRGEVVADYGFGTIINDDWSFGNMLSSLDCALRTFSGPLIVSYADILYNPATVRDLIVSDSPLAVAYDRDWLSLWQRRFDDPLSDAETFRLGTDGNIAEIGGKTVNVADIEGQFMGLMKLGLEGRKWIENLLAVRPEARLGMDTTTLLSTLITEGKPIRGIPATGGWCEIDDLADWEVAEALVAEGRLVLTGRGAEGGAQ